MDICVPASMSKVSDEQTDSKKFICWVHRNPLVWIMKARCSIINVCMLALCSCACLACEGNFIILTPLLFIQTWRTCTHSYQSSHPSQLKTLTFKKEKKRKKKLPKTRNTYKFTSPTQSRYIWSSLKAGWEGKINKSKPFSHFGEWENVRH